MVRSATFTLNQILKLILYFGAFQLLLALMDLPLQRYFHAERLRMTREDLKKEMKQSEGDPQLKQQRRERGTQITRGEMMKNVETATVIMVNPEHYAVALKWRQGAGRQGRRSPGGQDPRSGAGQWRPDLSRSSYGALHVSPGRNR